MNKTIYHDNHIDRELFRAKEYSQDNWITSDSIAWIDNELHLFDGKSWVMCHANTRSISYPNMIDKNGKKIFASLSEDGVGGDYTNCKELQVVFLWDKLNACITLKGKYEETKLFKDGSTTKQVSTFSKHEVIGIHKG